MPKNVVPHKRSNHGHNLDYAPSKGVSTFTPKNTSFTVDYSSIKSEIFKKSPKFYAVQFIFFCLRVTRVGAFDAEFFSDSNRVKNVFSNFQGLQRLRFLASIFLKVYKVRLMVPYCYQLYCRKLPIITTWSKIRAHIYEVDLLCYLEALTSLFWSCDTNMQ